ncbi:glycosyltransferase family 1 protein [Gilvimarinus sp. SDUM040013]|uniref:Glycosyltransferase family 1 protein n=1 Tax=Gilvimarinus gilvus TaxID=3058038 RepID=A0ABU4RVW6_9GAMM|nr:glycosyltransferase family 1 protein [Gilvimarinus sp. SDUM040013]MDO3387327.1 glycosyltransferase family 1 protein [Gilvimarinus sp. SDUM040013]MDX6849016.1 glycosyltransferase family 1 protein [Gilvimarinus sp. SDUM040013]
MSDTMQAPRRIFIECTHTYFVGGSSGIRRVARNLANSHKTASSDEAQLVPLVWAGRCFLTPRWPLTEAAHPFVTWGGRVLSLASQVIGTVARWPLLTHIREPLKESLRKLHQKRHRRKQPGSSSQAGTEPPSQGSRGNSDGFYRVFGLLMWPLGFLWVKRVRFSRGDIVILVDSTWDSPAMLEALFSAREREGIQVAPMLHDLFPLTLPQMCQARTVAGYTGWFQQVSERADFFITNSAATTQALKGHLQLAGAARARELPAGNFRLGAELHQEAQALTGSNPLEALSGFVVLAVGTIEPRKNYKIILDALDLLWETHDVSLVIVGRPGWSSESVMARLREHPQKGQQLMHLDDADDATLNACYRRADALVCASWAEGFGLPIVEGLRHGAPVVASDIDVFREVGGEHCRYFAPDRPEALVAALQQLVQQWQQGAPVRQEECDLAISWQESAIQFRDEVLRLADAASRSTASVCSAARSQQKRDA